MASIRKLKKDDPNSPWVVEYTDHNGKRRRLTPKSGLRRDAKDLATKIEAEMQRGEHVPTSMTVTVGDALDQWLERTRKRVAAGDGLRDTTAKNYYIVAEKYVRPKLSNVKLTQLTHQRVQAWIDEVAYGDGKLLSKSHMGTIIFVLRCVVEDAFMQGHVGRNILKIHDYRIPGKAMVKVEIPEKAEVRAMLETAGIITKGNQAPYLRTLLSVIVYAGLRAGEVRGLHWSQVDFEAGVIRVRQQARRDRAISVPKTEAGIRDVPIAAPLMLELKKWHLATAKTSHEKAGGYVFFSRSNRVITHCCAWASFASLQRRMKGLPFDGDPTRQRYDLHALRHVAASLFIESGLPPKRIQAIMGHTSITMTFDLYGHLFEDEKGIRRAMDRVSLG